MPKIKSLTNEVVNYNVSEADFSNDLSSMNTFFEDDNRDALIYGLKLVRFLPFFIFNTYVLGGGNYHPQFMIVLNNIKSIISTITNFKNSHILYGAVGDFIINELNYFVNTLAPQMNSPLTVNNKSVHLITSLIKNSLFDDRAI
jgi:hypothetical protein